MKSGDQHEHKAEMLRQMLKYSGEEMLEEQGDLLSDEDDDSELPPALQDSIRQMIVEKRAKEQEQQKQLAHRELRRKVVKKLVASVSLVVAIGLIGGSLIMSVDAWRIPFLNFVFNVNDDNTEMEFDNPDEDNPIRVPAEIPTPQYIPQGFSVESSSTAAARTSIIYKSQNGDHIVFLFYQSDETLLTLYTNEDKTPVKINNYDGYLIPYAEGSAIIWGVEDNIFHIYGDVSQEELQKIAESVK